MPGFTWDENPPPQGVESEGTVTDDLDTQMSPEDEAWASEDPKVLQRLARTNPPVQPAPISNQQVDDVMDDIMEQTPANEPEEDGLSEVEYRLEKAQCYKLLLNHQLIDGDGQAAIEVENEVQDFVRQRLGELMGVRAETRAAAPVPVAQIKQLIADEIAKTKPAAQFANDEVQALRAVANKVLKKPEIAAPAVKEPSKPPSIKPAAQAHQPPPQEPLVKTAPSPESSPTRRGRGRPRKTPCAKCGQMVCVCSKPTTRPVIPGPSNNAQVRPPARAPGRALAAPKKPVIEEKELGTDDDGNRIVERGGRRYKLIQRPKMQPDGSMKMGEVALDITPIPKSSLTKPFPQQEMANANAIQEAAQLVAARNKGLLGHAIQLWQSTPHDPDNTGKE